MTYKVFYIFLLAHIFLSILNYCILDINYRKIKKFIIALNTGLTFAKSSSDCIADCQNDDERKKYQINFMNKIHIYFSAIYKYQLYVGDLEQFKNTLIKIRNLNCTLEEFDKFWFEIHLLDGQIQFRRNQLWKLFLPTNFIFNLINILLVSTFQTEKIYFADSILEKSKFIMSIFNAFLIIMSLLKIASPEILRLIK